MSRPMCVQLNFSVYLIYANSISIEKSKHLKKLLLKTGKQEQKKSNVKIHNRE